MITKIAEKIADWLVKGGSIDRDERDLYQYGIFFFFTAALFLASAVILGLLLGVLLGSVLFFIDFFLIRQFAGGYHAKTEARCQVLSLVSIVSSILIISIYKDSSPLVLMLFTNAFSIVIFLLSPVDTAERDLAPEEVAVFRKISRCLVVVSLCIADSSYFFSKEVCTAFCVAICLEGILLSSAFLKKAFLRTLQKPQP